MPFPPIATRPDGRLRLHAWGALVTIGAFLAACSSSPPPSAPTASSSVASASPQPPSVTRSAAGPRTFSTPAPSSARPEASPSATPSRATTLTSEQLAGQRIIYSYPGLTPPSALLQLIRAGEAAGVIFFGQNTSSDSQLGAAIAELRRAQADSPVHEPLLLMTDQEGGQIRRLPGAPVLSAKQIGATGDPSVAAAAGSGAAQNLTGVGMNVNLAPVLDVFHSADDFDDQAERSFSSDPSVVASMGRAFVEAQQRGGVAATAKHFPGLGAASRDQNTDLGPVTLDESLSTLRGVDEAPYRGAISAGAKLTMVSWAIYPALDPTRPAGLSAAVVQKELRTRLGFTGVTITDALEAKALNAFGTTGQRAIAAASAGMDLLLCSAQDVSQGEAATSALVNALNSEQLDPSAFRAAADRVTALRAGLR
jgi:beta-N-acetylhexosaminidase